MMTMFCFLFVVAVTVDISYAGPEEMTKILAECKTMEKVADTDLMNFQNKVKLDTKEVKCLTTCVMEKMGLINNKQINKESCLKLAKMMPNSNEKMVQSVAEIVDECKVVQEADRCEHGAKVAACLKDAAGKRQLNNVFM